VPEQAVAGGADQKEGEDENLKREIYPKSIESPHL